MFTHWSPGVSVGVVTRVREGLPRNSGFDPDREATWLVWWFTQPPIQCLPGAVYLGVTHTGYEADPLFGAIARVEWSYTGCTHFSVCHHGMHWDNFTQFYPSDSRLCGPYHKFAHAFIGNCRRLSLSCQSILLSYVSWYPKGKLNFFKCRSWVTTWKSWRRTGEVEV
jgi:hypothetical protein